MTPHKLTCRLSTIQPCLPILVLVEEEEEEVKVRAQEGYQLEQVLLMQIQLLLLQPQCLCHLNPNLNLSFQTLVLTQILRTPLVHPQLHLLLRQHQLQQLHHLRPFQCLYPLWS